MSQSSESALGSISLVRSTAKSEPEVCTTMRVRKRNGSLRDDQPRSETCKQIALVIRDEVADLQDAGIKIIQIDEPAIREGLPLRRGDWPLYLKWSVKAFRLASSSAKDETQIHTHM